MTELDTRLERELERLGKAMVEPWSVDGPDEVLARLHQEPTPTGTRSRRRWPRLLAAVAAVAILVGGTAALMQSRSSDRDIRVGTAGDPEESPSDSARYEDTASHLSVVVPEGWSVAPEPYATHLLDPGEILAAASYPLPPTGSAETGCDAQIPLAPLEVLPGDGVFVWMVEAGADSERRNPEPDQTLPPKPDRIDLDAMQTLSCHGSEVRFGWYELTGRNVGIYVAVGPDVPTERLAETRQLIDSTVFTFHVQTSTLDGRVFDLTLPSSIGSDYELIGQNASLTIEGETWAVSSERASDVGAATTCGDLYQQFVARRTEGWTISLSGDHMDLPTCAALLDELDRFEVVDGAPRYLGDGALGPIDSPDVSGTTSNARLSVFRRPCSVEGPPTPTGATAATIDDPAGGSPLTVICQAADQVELWIDGEIPLSHADTDAIEIHTDN
jgi:hypothetical protein